MRSVLADIRSAERECKEDTAYGKDHVTEGGKKAESGQARILCIFIHQIRPLFISYTHIIIYTLYIVYTSYIKYT